MQKSLKGGGGSFSAGFGIKLYCLRQQPCLINPAQMVTDCEVLCGVIERTWSDSQVRWYQLCMYIIINMFYCFSDLFFVIFSFLLHYTLGIFLLGFAAAA